MRIEQKIATFLIVFAACLPARADIGLLLDAKPNVHVELGNSLTGAGHAGVYLSGVCTVSPVELRLCNPGELGAVIQNYQDYKEDQPYEWNAVPLSVYLYGVDEPSQRPLFASPELREALQQHYRQTYLHTICTTERCIADVNANWRDSVAAAFVREVYIFEVKTTQEQDEQFIREFNARANSNHYNGFHRNCADFAKLVVNTYFPHSTHRDVINDFGMTGPKAIARSFAHYAQRHPELDFRVVRVEQLPGTYPRSSDCKEGTEQTVRSMKWLVPIIIVSHDAVPLLAASYFLTGRFDPDHELRKHPSESAALLTEQIADAQQAGDKAARRAMSSELKAEKERELGDDQQWDRYRQRFEEVLRSAIADGVVSDRRELRTAFRELQAHGSVYLDEHQQLWLQIQSDGRLRHVGLSTANINSAGSDPRLGLRLLLARTSYLLEAKANHRELYPEFETDWLLLQEAESALATTHNPHRLIAETRH